MSLSVVFFFSVPLFYRFGFTFTGIPLARCCLQTLPTYKLGIVAVRYFVVKVAMFIH